MKKNSIKKSFLYNMIYQVVKIITPLITMPYLSRVLGAQRLGIYSYTYSVASYFVMFAVLGMSTYGVRLIAQAQDDRTKRSNLFWGAYCSEVIVSVLITAVYIVYATVLATHNIVALLWVFLVLSCSFDISWLYFGVEDFKRTTIRSLIVKTLDLLFIFLLVKSKNDLWLYVLIESLNYLFSQIILWPFLHEYVDWNPPKLSEVISHLKPSLVLFIPVIAISLYTTMNRVLLGNLSSLEQTAFYDYASRMCSIPSAIVTAFGTVMLPRMSSEFSLGKNDAALKLIQISLWVMLLGAFALSFGIVGIADEFIPLFLGNGFEGVKKPLLIICWEIPVICCSNVIGRQYMLPNNRDQDYTITVCCGALSNIVACLLLIPSFGAIGAAIGTVIAELTVLVVQLVVTCDTLPFIRYAMRCIPFIMIGAVMTFIMRFVAPILQELIGSSAIMLLLEFFIGASVYIILTLIYCKISNSSEFSYLINGDRTIL